MKILSVDDNAQNRYLIEALGQAKGFEVVSARNGLEALETLDSQPVDLIVSDVLMPEMDGFQLCFEVKSRERTRRIPLIFYTATYTATQDADLGLALGASRYVLKPVDPDEFMTILGEVISEAQKRELAVPEGELKGTVDYVKAYTARLVHKLDRKIEQLGAARNELQGLLAARDSEIAQRKRAEEALAASESRLSALLESASQGIVAVGEDGRVVLVNARTEEMFGYARDELLGQPVEVLLPERYRTAHAEHVRHYFAHPHTRVMGFGLDLHGRSKNGNEFPVEVTLSYAELNGSRLAMALITDITERKKAEQALVEKRARLEELTTALEMAYAMVWTAGGVITHWSRGAVTMYGWTPDEAIGRRPHELLKTEFPEPLEKIQAHLMEHGNWEGELRHHRRDGTTVVVASYWWLQRDERGQPSAVVEINDDTTALREAQEALRRERVEQAERESLAQFRTLADAIPQLCWMANADGWIFWYNERWYDYTGTTFEQMEGWGWQSVHDPKVLPKVLERWKASIGTGAPLDMVFPLRGADGVFRPFLTRVMPMRDQGGKVVRWFGTSTDISEQQKIEQALRESEARFRALATASSDVVYRMSPDWREMRHLRGRDFIPDTDAPSDTWLQEYIPPDDQPHVMAVINEAIRTKSIFELEHRVRRVDGSLGWTFSRAIPMQDAGGEITEWCGAASDITERKQAVEALRDSEERLRLAQHVARIGTFEWNIQTGVDRWTPELEAMYGLPPGGFAGTQPAWEELVHPEDRPEAVRRIQKAMDTGGFEGEWRVIQPNGAVRWLSGRAWVFKDDSGKPLRLIGVNIDITERKQAEEALRESEERLRLAHQVARIGTFEWNIQTGVNRWTPELEAMYGLPPGGFAGTEQAWEELVHPEDRPEVVRRIQKAMETGAFEGEWRVIQPDGAVRWLFGRAWVFKDDSGKPLRLVGANIDITDRKLAEEALRESEERLRLAHQVAGVGSFDWNIQTDVNRWTPELETIYGLPPGGFAGTERAWEDLVHPEDRPEIVRRMLIAIETCGHMEGEWRVIQPGGAVRWVFGRAWAFPDDYGKPLRLVGVNIDITERKQAEEEIRKLNAELERRVRERTAQLEAANKELETFAYSVSHDLRAPLRGIDGWSLALIEDYRSQLDERACQYLDRVRSETQHMGLLIDDLLQLSRITRGEIQRGAVDLTSLAQSIVARLREEHAGREIEFTISRGLEATGDARLLEVALTNLLGNAAKFTGPRAQARVEFGQTECDGERAFYVRDNGVGFDMAYANTLFGAFQRLHKKSDFPGTGIGLATVQRVIRRHGGRVWAEAQPDRGATFYFTVSDFAR